MESFAKFRRLCDDGDDDDDDDLLLWYGWPTKGI